MRTGLTKPWAVDRMAVRGSRRATRRHGGLVPSLNVAEFHFGTEGELPGVCPAFPCLC